MPASDAIPGLRRCAACDYDLTGTDLSESAGPDGPVGARCPECGEIVSGAGVLAVRERRTLRRVLRVALVLIVLLMTISATVLIVTPEWAPWLLPLLFFVLGPVAPIMLAAISGSDR